MYCCDKGLDDFDIKIKTDCKFIKCATLDQFNDNFIQAGKMSTRKRRVDLSFDLGGAERKVGKKDRGFESQTLRLQLRVEQLRRRQRHLRRLLLSFARKNWNRTDRFVKKTFHLVLVWNCLAYGYMLNLRRALWSLKFNVPVPFKQAKLS